MNKETTELIKQYVSLTASEGISEEAYKVLGYILQTDRLLAAALCDVYEHIKPQPELGAPDYKIDNSNVPLELEAYEL